MVAREGSHSLSFAFLIHTPAMVSIVTIVDYKIVNNNILIRKFIPLSLMWRRSGIVIIKLESRADGSQNGWEATQKIA